MANETVSACFSLPQLPPFFDLRISSPMDALGFPCLFPCFFCLMTPEGKPTQGSKKIRWAAQVVMMRACQHENIAQLFGVFQVHWGAGRGISWGSAPDCVRKMMEIHGFSFWHIYNWFTFLVDLPYVIWRGIQSVMLIQVSKDGG